MGPKCYACNETAEWNVSFVWNSLTARHHPLAGRAPPTRSMCTHHFDEEKRRNTKKIVNKAALLWNAASRILDEPPIPIPPAELQAVQTELRSDLTELEKI